MATPAYSHIVVVVMENHNYNEIAGNPQAPYINSLMAGGANLTNFTASTHPSQPNYFALYAGSTFGTTDDNQYSEPDPTLYTVLHGAGLTFTGYVDQGGGGSDFNHDPWVSFPEGRSVQTDFTSFPALFPSGDYSSLPAVSYVIPSVTNDMHNGTIAAGDSWLQANLAGYAQWALTNNSLLVVVWDENNDESGAPVDPSNQVPAILYGANVVPGNYNTAYNDYNLLSTITGAFGLTGPNNAATAAPIEVFGATPVAPTIAITSAAEASEQPSQTIAGTVTSGGAALVVGQTVTLTDNGVALTTSAPIIVQAGGAFTANVTLPYQGANSIVASVTDSLGNKGASAAVVDTLDNIAPTIVIASAAEASNQPSQTIAGTVTSGGAALVVGQTVTLTDNGVALIDLRPDHCAGSGAFSASVTLPYQERSTASSLSKVTDSLGNVGASAAVVDTLDNIAPTVAFTTVAETSNQPNQTLMGAATTGAKPPRPSSARR